MIVISLGIISVGVIFGIFNLILIPYLSAQFGSQSIPGQLISLGMLSTIFLSPLLGFLSDRIRKRTPFIFAITLMASLGIIGLTLHSLVLKGISAVILVASAYSFLTPYSALVSDYSTIESKDRNYGFVTGVMSLSTFITSLFIRAIYDSKPNLTFLVLGIVVLISIAPTMIYTKKHPVKFSEFEAGQKNSNSFNVLRKYPGLLAYFIMEFGLWFALGGLFPYLTSFLNSEASMNIGTASAWIGASTFFSGIVSFATGKFSKIIGQKRLFIISLTTITSFSAVIALFYHSILTASATSVFAIACFITLSIATGFLYSLNSSILSTMVSEIDQGKVFGINSVIVVISQSISVSLIGSVIDSRGYQWMFVVISLSLVLANISAFYISSFPIGKNKKNQTVSP
ncbi:MFS transporter [Kosmotoga sp. DU53]|nr:MFS transporter [Kosmotoga sp. DU53]OAA22184.1 hypothetical protein DU53_04905 [Kosmotoga sp. DU53]